MAKMGRPKAESPKKKNVSFRLTEEEYQEIRQGCADYDLPVHVDGLIPEEVLLATKKDKKMEQGHIKFILMDGIGKSFIDKTVTDEELLSCIQEITL
mgnify:CR=1 FL=1